MSSIDILVSEVGPRDGLQSIKAVMPTAAKKAWIKAEADAGVPEIEVGSFVPPKLLPQLADTAEIVEYARSIPGLAVAVLVPNFKGAENAIKAGAHKITLPLSVSETHSLANLKKTHEQVYDEVRKITELLSTLPADQRPDFEGGLSTAFGCTRTRSGGTPRESTASRTSLDTASTRLASRKTRCSSASSSSASARPR